MYQCILRVIILEQVHCIVLSLQSFLLFLPSVADLCMLKVITYACTYNVYDFAF